MRRVILLILIGLWLAPIPSVEAAEAGDAAAGRDLITRQIEAFKSDDGEAAFGYATPTLRSMFGSAETFLEMVRRGYPPVYRPRTLSFGPVRDAENGFEQAVEIQDQQGADWDAVYSFERQPDGAWKISGCRLVKKPGEGV